MKLCEIGIKNFRLLQDARMRLDTTGITTILVGPNNSGKTSTIEAMLAFLQRPIRQLSINDFSLGCRDAFKKFETHVLTPPAVAAAGAPAAEPPPLTALPVLSLQLKFDYDDTGPDLALAGELLMDLEDASTTVTVEIRFGPANPQQLAEAYLKDRDDDQSFADYLAVTLHDHYKLDQFKLSPDGTQAERLPDRSILQRLTRIDVVSAQRHIDDREEGSKATRLSTLLHAHYERRYKVDAPSDFKALEKTLREQSTALGPQYVKAFDGLMKGLAKFGHPESPKLTVRAERIADCLTNGRSFVLDAGAGAGKTYSLVEGLNKLCAPPIADRLKRDGQQIACITYTNVAKDQVIERIQGNSLVRVSTIHDFLWSTLQPHQQALRQALLDFNGALSPASARRVDQAELRAKVDAGSR